MKKDKQQTKVCKKEKVIYYDDGSSITDMDCLKDTKKDYFHERNRTVPRATEKEKMHTFFTAMRMMIIPTIIALGVILLLYIILCLIAN